MNVTTHFTVLASIVAGTLACLLVRGGLSRRPFWSVLLAFLPFWLIGITGSLLLSINGVPTVEWIVPGVAVLLLGFFCKSDAVFTSARWGLLAASVLLCVNFLVQTTRDYTASPERTRGAAAAYERAELLSLRKQLDEQAGGERPAGEVGKLTVRKPVAEWHTPLTRLHRIERTPAVVWFPGGKVGEAELQVKAL